MTCKFCKKLIDELNCSSCDVYYFNNSHFFFRRGIYRYHEDASGTRVYNTSIAGTAKINVSERLNWSPDRLEKNMEMWEFYS